MPHPSHPPCSHHSILVESINHEAPHYAIFSTPLSPCPTQAQISPSAPYTKHPQPMFYPQCTDQFSHPHKIAPYILIFSLISLCDVPNASFNYLYNAGHPYKIWQSLLSRGRNILALYWSQQFSYQLHKTAIGPSSEPIKSTLPAASSCHILIFLYHLHLASSFEVCFPTKILGQSPLTEEKQMHLDCAVQAYTVLINNNLLQDMNINPYPANVENMMSS